MLGAKCSLYSEITASGSRGKRLTRTGAVSCRRSVTGGRQRVISPSLCLLRTMTNAVSERETYTVYLSGFSQALNWRPTEFVRRLHRVRVCNLCGVVPSEATFLECSHVFCKTCYDGVVGCGQGCPIDGASFDETQVTPLKFPESDLLKREVRCWNKHRGCDFSGTLADALNHFHEVCTFHEVKCVKCHKMVRQRDMLDHYTRGCKGESGEEGPATVSLAKDILKSTKEVEAILATLADTQASLQDSFSKLTAETRSSSQSVEKRIDDQKAELAHVRQNQEESARLSHKAFEDMRASLTRIPGWIRHQDWLKKNFRPVFQTSDDEVYWSVENVSHLLERSRKTTEEQVVSEPFSIAGYTARLCVKLVEADNDTNVRIFFVLCRGPKDEELDWPFVASFVLSLVHPEDRKRDSRKAFDPLEPGFSEAFERPTTAYNVAVGGSCFAKASTLNEFVFNDAILVSVRVLR